MSATTRHFSHVLWSLYKLENVMQFDMLDSIKYGVLKGE